MAGTILQGGQLLTGADRQELKEQAINHFYTNSESLLFGALLLKGGVGLIKGKSGTPGAKAKYTAVKSAEWEALLKRDYETKAKEAKPKVPSEPEAQIAEIEAMTNGELAFELLDLQKGAKEPLSAKEIAKMSRAEKEHIVSGGRIGVERGAKPPEVAAAEKIIAEEKAPPPSEPAKAAEKPAEPAEQAPIPPPEPKGPPITQKQQDEAVQKYDELAAEEAKLTEDAAAIQEAHNEITGNRKSGSRL